MSFYIEHHISAVISKTLVDTRAVNAPLVTETISVAPGVTYWVQVKVMMGDLDNGDGANENVAIGIDGKSSETCTPSGLRAGSCEWYTCSGLSDLTANSAAVNLRFQYGSGYDYYYSGPCQVNGTSSVYAAAIITLTPKGNHGSF